MRLIDADALIPIMKYNTTDNEIGVFPIRIGFNTIKRVIDEAPTIDAVDVYKALEEEHLNIINRIKELQYAIAKTQTIVGKMVESADAVHGEWIPIEETLPTYDGGEKTWLTGMKCSNCGKLFDLRVGYHYCPNCGARMKGGDDE